VTGWPPQVGEPLPRAADCWYEPVKLERWILAARGHGNEWAKVLHVGPDDIDVVWAAIAAAILPAPVSKVIDTGEHGVNCRVDVALTIGERSAPVRTAWNYADAASAPRLVSAYPRL
jgi:hypothetical protein